MLVPALPMVSSSSVWSSWYAPITAVLPSTATEYPNRSPRSRGTGGYESATGHKSISHEAAPPTIDPRIVRQMPLVDASSQIYELWRREGLQGFTGMRFDNDKGEVILYWKRQVPHRMVALVRTLRASVPVRVVERPYSLVELQREARRLVELDLSGAGVNVTEAGPLADFSGIGVGIEPAGDAGADADGLDHRGCRHRGDCRRGNGLPAEALGAGGAGGGDPGGWPRAVCAYRTRPSGGSSS